MAVNQSNQVELNVKAPSIAVFGLGFVGLPLALSFSMRGCRVVGVDVVDGLVSELNEGVTHHQESYKTLSIRDILKNELSQGRFRATTDAQEALRDTTAILVTVGIPLGEGEPIFEPLVQVFRTIAVGLKAGDTVVLRSTVVPGTTEEVVLPILETSGLKAGSDFYLAYASERIAEGRAFDEFENMPCLVAGVNQVSTERAKEVLSHITKASFIEGSCIKVVETTKVIENVQRDVNIAMVQEFARFTERFGIDIFEVVRLANTHRRVHLLEPGPGVGGYCIPNALHYLTPKATQLGLTLELAETARQINDRLPEFVASMVDEAVSHVASDVAPRIAALGVAMKDYSNDDRLSPAKRVVDLLLHRGYEVKAYDPAVPTRYPYKVDSLAECCTGAHCVLILAKQHGVTPEAVLDCLSITEANCAIVDTRNFLGPAEGLAGNARIIRI